jgi:hypothetical protein
VPHLLSGSPLTGLKRRKQFAICVRNKGAEDLEVRKVYELLPDARAAKEGYVRVIDESGEDYLYPGAFFVPIQLPRGAGRSLSITRR